MPLTDGPGPSVVADDGLLANEVVGVHFLPPVLQLPAVPLLLSQPPVPPSFVWSLPPNAPSTQIRPFVFPFPAFVG